MTAEPLERILHIDDDPDIRTIIRLALETVGQFNVAQYSTADEVFAGVDDFGPQLFLLDVMMPELSGVDLWKQLVVRPGLAEVPAIFLTAKAEDEFSKELKEAGALAVIKKPVNPMTLADDLRAIWSTRPQ